MSVISFPKRHRNQVLWIDPEVVDALSMSAEEFIDRYFELCDMGIITEVQPATETEGPRYVRSSMPLKNPEQYSEEVRRKHAENYAQWHDQVLFE